MSKGGPAARADAGRGPAPAGRGRAPRARGSPVGNAAGPQHDGAPGPGRRSTAFGRGVALAAPMAFAVAAGAPACASSRPDEVRPTASLSRSGAAAQSFAYLRRRWASADHEERLALEPDVRSLRALHGHEPVAAVAELYLAWLALEKGDVARAQSIASSLERAGPGATLDVARAVRGAALAHAGRPDEALAWLRPLRGKLLDLDARALYYEATSRALVETKRWGEAIDLFDAWLRDGSDETRPELAARVERALEAVPAPALEGALREMRDRAAEGVPRHADLTRRLVTKRLAALAVERGDAPLARRLLARRESFGDLGDASAGVAELAGLDTPEPRVVGRALGVLLPRARGDAGRRALAFSQGLLGALRAPPGEAPRVLTRSLDEPGSDAHAALQSLVAEGAGVVVGGFDPDGARQLAEFAELEGVVALLAVPPSSWPPGARWTFALGVDEAAATGLVAAAMAERSDALLLAVGPAPPGARPLAPCPDDAAARHGFGERLLEGARPNASARSLLLGGDEGCASQALAALSRGGRRLAVGLGLEASALLAAPPDPGAPRRPAPAAGAFVRVGCYPVDDQGRPSAPLAALAARTGRAPSWWALLGHEAASLAVRALAPLPLDASRDAADVRYRRELALAGARNAPPLPCLGVAPGPGPGGPRPAPRVSFMARDDAPPSPNVSAPR